ncbi:nuclear transport factor 2 family protein [Carboxylicivirga sediminis]|uniref:Nuclear transport factor 2 family protein n=1 Tax=Carboxylicivirga sediminis TaxID=2006564 RepID=A0A941F782_9BACT|nr:nuclear transport factor 2 family protein [Carboxylicivirga sediminis]MBR8538038.1 nuclear transport factor 2 family protein [Carboxylicivirga sediminis]
MRKLQFVVLLMCFVLSASAQSDEAEVKAIKEVIQSAYVEGIQNEGDIEKIDAGIHPDFNLLGIGENGTIWKLPIAEWKEKVIERKKNGQLPRDKDNLISVKFLSVDVTGTAAVAKFEFYVGKELKYVDYLSLYKFEEGWKLVSKIFYKFED